MKVSPYRPRVHLFVCANRRDSSDPLGSGCGERGEAVFAELKKRTRSMVSSVWVSRTQCLGLCPKKGCTVAIAPAMQYVVEVESDDLSVFEPLFSAAR
jgi:hypothetical protein